MTPFERSVAFWLHAYPRRWRVARAAEVTVVLADLAAPGARLLSLRAALGLVAGGWVTRWREHPPFWRWLGYHVAQRRLPAELDDWVRDERAGLLTGLRSAALPFMGLAVVAAGVEGELRHLGWVAWTFTTTPLLWWVWLAIALVQAVARAVGREEWMEAYFPTAVDRPGHFGPYVPLKPAAPVVPAARAGTEPRDA